MAWITTDTDVACTLIIDKIVNGQHVTAYPRTYSILALFSVFPAISIEEWRKMIYSERQERITAFKNYVNSIENIDIDAVQTNSITQPTTGNIGEIVQI
jgi:hypothetical protein